MTRSRKREEFWAPAGWEKGNEPRGAQKKTKEQKARRCGRLLQRPRRDEVVALG